MRIAALSLMLWLGLGAFGPLDGTVLQDGDDEFTYAYQLLGEDDPAAFARYLTTHIHAQDYYCGAVTDYQVITRSIRRLTVKARCLGMPLYGLSFRPQKQPQVFGGDGMISALSNSDGPVVSVPLVSVKQREGLAPTAVSPVLRLDPEGEWELNLGPWVIASLIANVLLVSALIYYIIASLRQPKRKRRRRQEGTTALTPVEVVPNARLSSAEKNTLIGQSDEISRLIHRHPSGIYIAKGRRGKRRIFSSLLGAILYRDFGLKWREIN